MLWASEPSSIIRSGIGLLLCGDAIDLRCQRISDVGGKFGLHNAISPCLRHWYQNAMPMACLFVVRVRRVQSHARALHRRDYSFRRLVAAGGELGRPGGKCL